MRRIVIALLGLLLAAPAWTATEVSEGQKWLYGPSGPPLMLFSPADSIGHALREGSTSGAALVSVVSAGERQSFGITQTDIPARALLKGPQPIDVSIFGSYTIHVAWATSDSDSVALRVMVVGKDGADAGDGLDYFFDSRPDTVGANGWLVCSTAQRLYNNGDVLVQNEGIVSFLVGGGLSTNQVAFPIVDSRGNAPRFQYLNIWVQNMTNTQIDDVTVTAWLKAD